MTDRAALGVSVAAFAVALKARDNSLTPHDVDTLRAEAEAHLDQGDDLRRAVIHFATHYEDLRRNAFALRILGEALERDVHTALGTRHAPPEERADLR
jgi:hypothetical protein